jgi:serine/threonine-protein kinase
MDLYAVGLLAYELLTGTQPFSGNSPQATMAAQLTRMPEPLEEACPDVPPQLAALVMRLLAKHPDDRPATAAAALSELEAFATPTGAATSAPASGEKTIPPASGQTTAPAPARRAWRLGPALAGAAIVVLVAGSALLARRRIGDPPVVAAPAVAAPAAPSPGDSLRVTIPPVRLTHADSLRIADAVRSEMAKARLNATRQPNAARNLDSLQRTLVRAYTDSAMREVRQGVRPTTPVAPGDAPRLAGASRVNPRPAAKPTPKPIFARPRKVAILPVRDATLKPEVSPTAHALDDSLRKALVAQGYTPATDAELVRLLSQGDLASQRRLADTLGIGAIVVSILSMRADELVAQSVVLDVWRNYPSSDRTATDLDKPREALGIVRDVSRALERVSWRSRSDPKRVLVFELENQTGMDTLGVAARALSDSLRATIAKRLGAEVVGDSAARATRDVIERRSVGVRLGAGALVAGGLYRARADSVTLRLSTRDMSEDRTFPPFEMRLARADLLTGFRALIDRVMVDLGQVNWGPKQSR